MVVDDSEQTILTLTKQELVEYCKNIIEHVVAGMFRNGAINTGVLCRWCGVRMSITACRNHQSRCDLNPRVIAERERKARIAKYSAKPDTPS